MRRIVVAMSLLMFPGSLWAMCADGYAQADFKLNSREEIGNFISKVRRIEAIKIADQALELIDPICLTQVLEIMQALGANLDNVESGAVGLGCEKKYMLNKASFRVAHSDTSGRQQVSFVSCPLKMTYGVPRAD